MVKYSEAQLDLVFHALAHSTRRALLQLILQSEISVCELASHFQMSLVAISKHLKVLELAGLIQRRKEGRNYYFLAVSRPMENADEWIRTHSKFWKHQLKALDSYLQDNP